MLICCFKDESPAQENGHYLMPEKKQYSQMLRILYSATKMFPITTEIGFLEADLDNNRVKTKWCILVEPDTTGDDFMYGIGAALKVMKDKEITESYTTLIFALQPNRPELVSSKGAYHSQIWGIRDDVDEEHLIQQVQTAFPDQTDVDSIKRKIYRQRVEKISQWPDINNEKFVSMPYNLIPQKLAKMDQLLNHSINDAWNEPTRIQVLILKQESVPQQMEFSLDTIGDKGEFQNKTVTLMSQFKHQQLSFNWQFGIDLETVHNFMHNWINMKRYL